MKTNDLKKGARVLLRNGWKATVADNAKGNTRMCEVEGDFTEIGSVYSHDIVRDLTTGERIEHTPAQIKLMGMVRAMGM